MGGGSTLTERQADELIGRASRILVSANIAGSWLPRLERFGKSLYD